MTFETKKLLRRTIKGQTATLSTDEKERQATLVTAKIKEIIQQKNHPLLAAFSPLPDELPIDLMALASHCEVVLPRVDSLSPTPRMEFYRFSPDTLSEGAYGINEPIDDKAVKAEQIDIAIIPGVAFTAGGHRLGRGKGYYDRYLSQEGFRAETIGVCFDHQLLDTIPCEPHDMQVKSVITASIIEQKD